MIRHSLEVSVQPKHIAATGTVLLRIGCTAFVIGCLGAGFVLLHAVNWSQFDTPTQPRPAATGPVIPPPEPPIVRARRIIPLVVAAVYMALDHGSPSAVTSVLSPNVRNNFRVLDAICRPYTYRAHYIETIVERPDNHYEAWVRVLFKPLDEHAYVLTFQNQGGTFVLDGIADPPENWFAEEKERALGIARQFIYAARAGKSDVLSALVAPDMPTAAFINDACWHQFFNDVEGVQDVSADLKPYNGLKVEVKMKLNLTPISPLIFRDYFGASYFLIERVGQEEKIVVADPLGTYKHFYLPQEVCPHASGMMKVEDPNLEARTLKRFHLAASAEGR